MAVTLRQAYVTGNITTVTKTQANAKGQVTMVTLKKAHIILSSERRSLDDLLLEYTFSRKSPNANTFLEALLNETESSCNAHVSGRRQLRGGPDQLRRRLTSSAPTSTMAAVARPATHRTAAHTATATPGLPIRHRATSLSGARMSAACTARPSPAGGGGLHRDPADQHGGYDA